QAAAHRLHPPRTAPLTDRPRRTARRAGSPVGRSRHSRDRPSVLKGSLSMSVDALKEALPAYAKDIKLNLGSVTSTSQLTEQQLWGTVLACAMATKSKQVIAELAEEAGDYLSAEAFEAAKGAASIMAM